VRGKLTKLLRSASLAQIEIEPDRRDSGLVHKMSAIAPGSRGHARRSLIAASQAPGRSRQLANVKSVRLTTTRPVCAEREPALQPARATHQPRSLIGPRTSVTEQPRPEELPCTHGGEM